MLKTIELPFQDTTLTASNPLIAFYPTPLSLGLKESFMLPLANFHLAKKQRYGRLL